MKDLPRVFANQIGEVNNTQDIFYGHDRLSKSASVDSISVIRKINRIFADSSHVYKSNVKITLKDKVVEKVIVGKTTTSLITIDGELIKIIDIVNIEKI